MRACVLCALEEFQSLTGRLKTAYPIRAVRQPLLFQSLTGRLKTKRGRTIQCDLRALFQSLTGRLKTAWAQGGGGGAAVYVSIPHR